MQADKKQKEWLEEALSFWQDKGLLEPGQASRLRQSIAGPQDTKEQLAKYFYIIAICCGALAFAAIFINDKILEQIRRYFSLSQLSIAIACGVAGLLLYFFAQRKKLFYSPNRELYLTGTMLVWLMSLLYFCKAWLPGGPYTPFLGMGTLLLTGVAIYFRSNVLWLLAVTSFIAWFGIFTEVHSTNNLFWGLNYPARYTLLGLLLLGLFFVLRRFSRAAFTGNFHFHAGIILLLSGLWGLSIFGNNHSLEEWHELRRQAAVFYGLLSGLAAVLFIILGLRFENKPLRDYGLAFLLLNLYTRYFELFWDAMNKGIFFLILSLSFAGLGWWLRRKQRNKAADNASKST